MKETEIEAYIEPRMSVTQLREKTHGYFSQNANIAQQIKDILHSQKPGWNNCTAEQREALEMIASKISRILSGNAKFADHWLDIEGYAKLGRGACTN